MIALRGARRDEAARLSEIARAAKAHWGYPPAWLAAWRDALTVTPELVDAAWVRVAERDGQPLGFVAVEEAEGACEITHLWVAPAAMGQGVGRALIAAALGHAATRTRRPVAVDAYPHAAPFYERLGFVRVGRVPAPMPGAAQRVLVALRSTPLPVHASGRGDSAAAADQPGPQRQGADRRDDVGGHPGVRPGHKGRRGTAE